MDTHSIRSLAQEFIAAYGNIELAFADTADDIERVYLNGPRSCMSHPAASYDSDEHPVRVYAAGDLSIAYLVAKDEDSEHITARSVCWPEKKIYSRVYGDDKLARMLESAGYGEGSLDGAKVARIPAGRGFVMPYVDSCCGAKDCGDHIKLGGRYADIATDQTNGLSCNTESCCACDGELDPDDAYHTCDGNMCEGCYSDTHVFCDHYQEHMQSEPVDMANGETWSERAFDRYGYTCDGNGHNYSREDEPCHEMPNGETWSETHFMAYGMECRECGDCLAAADSSDGLHCDDCLPSDDDAETETPTYDNEGAHVLIPGRDESPAQAELPIASANYDAGGAAMLAADRQLTPMEMALVELFGQSEYPMAEADRNDVRYMRSGGRGLTSVNALAAHYARELAAV